MRLSLTDMLALSGRLTDQPGPDTGRERWRRFLDTWQGSLADLQALIEDGQRAQDDQSQRALLDLVVTIGRHLGCAVTYGVYDRRSGAVRFDGAWRSPGLARIILEVRTDRTRPFSPEDLARTMAALPDVERAIAGERTVGLCITVPLHGRRRLSDLPNDPALTGPARQLPLHGVIALAERVVEHRMTHAQAVEALLGVDDGLIAGGERTMAGAADPAPVPATLATPHLSLVPRDDPPDYWMATILPDGGTTPAQFIDAVIRGRKVLGLRAIGIVPSAARPGDWVCFFVAGQGIVGHARLGQELDRAAAPLRAADEYTAIFALESLALYNSVQPIDLRAPGQRLASRVPFDASGPILSALSQADFEALTYGAGVAQR